MSYKIGDVAKLLNMTVEKIRYYETENIIKPLRETSSKYRMYETWDIFYLLEGIKFRSLDISVRDISKIHYEESIDFYLKKLEEKQEKLANEIIKSSKLLNLVERYRKKLETVELNVGNYWFEKIPEQKYFIFLESEGDNYGEIDSNGGLFAEWIRYIPFIEFCEHIDVCNLINKNKENHGSWSLLMSKEYIDYLNPTINDSVNTIPEHIALCTIINAGSKGNMGYDLLNSTLEYIKSNKLKIDGLITGKLIFRTHSENEYCRYFEIQIPVKKS